MQANEFSHSFGRGNLGKMKLEDYVFIAVLSMLSSNAEFCKLYNITTFCASTNITFETSDCVRVRPTLYILDCEEICATQVTDQCQSWTLNGDQSSPVFVAASKTHTSVCLKASLVAESDECLRLQCHEKLFDTTPLVIALEGQQV